MKVAQLDKRWSPDPRPVLSAWVPRGSGCVVPTQNPDRGMCEAAVLAGSQSTSVEGRCCGEADEKCTVPGSCFVVQFSGPPLVIPQIYESKTAI